MKTQKLFAIASALLILCSCENVQEEITIIDIPDKEIQFNEGIYCRNGCLYFPSAEVCLQTMIMLGNGNTAYNEFQKKFNFLSLRSVQDDLMQELGACETQEEYDSIWETCTDFLKRENDYIIPKIESIGYASIANIDGVFYVNNIKHIITPESIIIETIDPATRTTQQEAFEYVIEYSAPSETRNGETTLLRYTDARLEADKYKVFSRTNVIRTIVYDAETTNKLERYITSYIIQVHTFGQKKKAIIGWNTYNDRFYIENLHFDLTIDGDRRSFNTYRNDFVVTEFSDDVYANVSFGPAIKGQQPANMPVEFNCIVHRCRSRSLNGCGVVTDRNCCRPAPELPIPQCIDVSNEE